MDAERERVKLSRALSRVLRHTATRDGVRVGADGFVAVEELRRLPRFATLSDERVREVVGRDEKKRYALRTEARTGALEIRANQGHSLVGAIDDDKLLERVVDWPDGQRCIHGTTRKAWGLIRTDGLRPMGRNHIHFAPGYFGEPHVVSGMRKNCAVFIRLDVEACLREGIPLFRSQNHAILSPGDSRGRISPRFFAHVQDANGKLLVE
uniref:2'-phosphotransferase n=1 Tax=Erythrolobus australicus TaxID=1077150 RepID=A0A7S1TNW9_9RHOD|mmetsp:Transcript_404/g.1061  ORF Transcript_404/g.1061 Transcript_404/m.1061 type:complete len:209 (+) Transcript_404:91-717(+)